MLSRKTVFDSMKIVEWCIEENGIMVNWYKSYKLV